MRESAEDTNQSIETRRMLSEMTKPRSSRLGEYEDVG